VNIENQEQFNNNGNEVSSHNNELDSKNSVEKSLETKKGWIKRFIFYYIEFLQNTLGVVPKLTAEFVEKINNMFYSTRSKKNNDNK
jgi:hypothetical protein